MEPIRFHPLDLCVVDFAATTFTVHPFGGGAPRLFEPKAMDGFERSQLSCAISDVLLCVAAKIRGAECAPGCRPHCNFGDKWVPLVDMLAQIRSWADAALICS